MKAMIAAALSAVEVVVEIAVGDQVRAPSQDFDTGKTIWI
jgi:hypothetical protein